jgi:hypothetical protein
MGLAELALAVIIAVAAAVGSGTPVAAWGRTKEPRFLLLAGSSLALLLIGILEAWGQIDPNAPGYATASLPILVLLALATVLLLATGLVPRRP